MATTINRTPWTSQPQQAVGIDWGNPITRGLVGWFTPFDNCANSGSAIRTAKSYGVCANGQGSYGFTKPLNAPVTLSRYSIFALTSGTVTTAERSSFGAGKSTASPILHVGHHSATSKIKMRVWCRSDAGSNPSDVFTSADVFDGKPHFAGLTYDGSTIRSYVDGNPDATNAFAGASFSFTHMALGASYRSGNVSVMSTHDVALGVLFDRQLTESEIRSLSQNPWQIFKPLPRRIFVSSPATSGLYTLTAQSGSYAISGQQATLLRHRNLTANTGTYNITGQFVNITYSSTAAVYTLTAQAGSYSITGSSITLLKSKLLSASSGSYSIAGNSATISKNRVLTTTAGSYTITGSSANLTYVPLTPVYTLTAQTGVYNITGQTAQLLRHRLLTTSAGSYIYTGQNITINKYTSGASNLVKYINVLTGEVLILKQLGV